MCPLDRSCRLSGRDYTKDNAADDHRAHGFDSVQWLTSLCAALTLNDPHVHCGKFDPQFETHPPLPVLGET